jgi:hypothetical protein
MAAMTVTEAGSEILKVDEVGRIQTPPEKRAALLAEFNRSGMTGAQFARFSEVRYPTLMSWLQKRRKEAGQNEPSGVQREDHPPWLEVRVGGEIPKSANIVVELGAGFACWWAVTAKPPWRASSFAQWDQVRDAEFSGSLRVFVAVEACDLRKGFEGLSALVGTMLYEEVKSGALFASSNRRRTRPKILYWDGSNTMNIVRTARAWLPNPERTCL